MVTSRDDLGRVGTLPEEGMQPLQKAEDRTLPIKRPSETESKFTEKRSEQYASSENCNINDNHVGLGRELVNGTSLSLEREAECLDLQSLLKNLETQNQKLSEENEKLLNKLSVQTKVCTFFSK